MLPFSDCCKDVGYEFLNIWFLISFCCLFTIVLIELCLDAVNVDFRIYEFEPVKGLAIVRKFDKVFIGVIVFFVSRDFDWLRDSTT